MQEVEDILVCSSDQEKYEYLGGLLIRGKYPGTLKTLHRAQREYSSTLFGRAVTAYTALLREKLEKLVDSALGDGGREAYLQAVALRDEVARPQYSGITRLCFYDVPEAGLALKWNRMIFRYEARPSTEQLVYMTGVSEEELAKIINDVETGDKVALGLARYLVRWQAHDIFCEMVAEKWLKSVDYRYPCLSDAVRKFNEEDQV